MSKKHKLPPELFEEMAEVIRILGHSQRLRILEHLDLEGERNVSDIVEALQAGQGAVSQHLNKMRMAGLLSCRREGREIYYRIAMEHPVTILKCIRRKHSSLQ